MKGILLGGFKVWIQDGKGLPLSAPGGRVKFYKANTSEPLEVYSSSAMDIPLGTIVATDINGYLPDVWLRSDFLYDVTVEKKIGDDPETWEKLFDVEDVGEIIVEKIDTPITSTTIVNNIAELRNVDYTLYGIAYVLGYNEAVDTGEPMMFRYKNDLRKVDDGGSVILPNDKLTTDDGRWSQVFSDSVIDVRKFGALPDTGSDLTAQIVNAITYCRDASKFFRPVTVAFMKPGKYSIRGNFDMDQYSYTADGNTEHVHYIINDGVVFNGLGAPYRLTIGRNTEVLSNVKLVSGYFALKVPDEFKGFVRPCWYKDMSEYDIDSEISDAVVLGEDGMFLKTTDCVTIYKDLHKIDLWDVTLKKSESENKGITMSLGSADVFKYEKGQQNSFTFGGKMYVSGIRDYTGTNVQGLNGGKYTTVDPGRIAVNDGSGNEAVIKPKKITVDELSTKKINCTNFVDITNDVLYDDTISDYKTLLDEYEDEEVGFTVVVYSRQAGKFKYYVQVPSDTTKCSTIRVDINVHCGIMFVKSGNRKDYYTGATHSSWIILGNKST